MQAMAAESAQTFPKDYLGSQIRCTGGGGLEMVIEMVVYRQAVAKPKFQPCAKD